MPRGVADRADRPIRGTAITRTERYPCGTSGWRWVWVRVMLRIRSRPMPSGQHAAQGCGGAGQWLSPLGRAEGAVIAFVRRGPPTWQASEVLVPAQGRCAVVRHRRMCVRSARCSRWASTPVTRPASAAVDRMRCPGARPRQVRLSATAPERRGAVGTSAPPTPPRRRGLRAAPTPTADRRENAQASGSTTRPWPGRARRAVRRESSW